MESTFEQQKTNGLPVFPSSTQTPRRILVVSIIMSPPVSSPPPPHHHVTPPPQQQQPKEETLFDNTLTPAQTRYLLGHADLLLFLQEKFPHVKDFKISVSGSPKPLWTQHNNATAPPASLPFTYPPSLANSAIAVCKMEGKKKVFFF